MKHNRRGMEGSRREDDHPSLSSWCFFNWCLWPPPLESQISASPALWGTFRQLLNTQKLQTVDEWNRNDTVPNSEGYCKHTEYSTLPHLWCVAVPWASGADAQTGGLNWQQSSPNSLLATSYRPSGWWLVQLRASVGHYSQRSSGLCVLGEKSYFASPFSVYGAVQAPCFLSAFKRRQQVDANIQTFYLLTAYYIPGHVTSTGKIKDTVKGAHSSKEMIVPVCTEHPGILWNMPQLWSWPYAHQGHL